MFVFGFGAALFFIGFIVLAAAGLIALVSVGWGMIGGGKVAMREASDELQKRKRRVGALQRIERLEKELAEEKRNWEERVEEGRKG